MDPSLAHERKVLAVFISRGDSRNQGVLAGQARWDGAALWLDVSNVPQSVVIQGPGAQTLLVDATPGLRAALAEGTEYGAELGPLVQDAEFVSFTEVTQMPSDALLLPGAFSHALVPGWRAS